MLTLYRVFFAPLALFFLLIGSLFSAKIRKLTSMRIYHRPDFDPQSRSVLWIHAASGEFEYAKPLIKKWKETHPDWLIFVSYFSPSFVEQIRSFPGIDGHAPLSLDLPGPVRAMVKRVRPTLFAVARTDVWPELIHQLHRQGVPSVLFSATFSRLRGYEKLFLPLWRWRYSRLSAICCVSQEDENNLKQRGVKKPIVITGDTRFDQVFTRLKNPKPLRGELKPDPGAPVVLLGSTWPSDEQVLIPALLPYVESSSIRLIIAPHEPSSDHISALEKSIQLHHGRTIRYSNAGQFATSDIMLVDKVGILAELYQWADAAFVGGSFGRGVHSVMEPLAAGCPTFVGPSHRNNREALQFKSVLIRDSDWSIVTEIQSAGDVDRLIRKLIRDANSLPRMKEQIKNSLVPHQGATGRLIASLDRQACTNSGCA